MPKTEIKDSPQADKKTIKFDMKTDEDVRVNARKGYEVAKIFKEAGLSFRKVVPAHTDLSIRKLFKLGASGPNFCLEVSVIGKTEEEQGKFVEEIKDQFLLMSEFNLVNDKQYKLDRGTTVHRFLFRPSKIQ
jgi:hypothetical protein